MFLLSVLLRVIAIMVLLTPGAKSFATNSQPSKPLRGPNVQPPRPNDNTYWITPKFIAGEYPGDRSGQEDATRKKLRRYLDLDITFFVDLTQEGEKVKYEHVLREEAEDMGVGDVGYVRLPVQDFGVPDEQRMKEILDAIDGANDEGRSVYVHCRGGIGRAGTTVGCYLARHGNTGEEALQEVNRLFQNSGRSYESYRSPETDEQERFVREWKDASK